MRSQVTVLFLTSFFLIKFAQAQTTSNELIVFGQTGKLYLEHTVTAKENWYSIGRLYNTSPKELAPFNHLALTQPLSIGQVVQIPLTAVNFSQNLQKTPAESLLPVYYITQEKEWMYRISVNHNRVPIPTLEKWNKMTKDAVRPGMRLIVGYLKVRTALSTLATNPPPPPAATPAISQLPASTSTAAAAPPAAATATTTAVNSAKPVLTKSVDTPISKPAVATASAATPSAPPSPRFDGGIFKSEFMDNGKSLSGMASIFKSTSGWQDGKYYALMNNIAIGSIVKVTDAAGKSVFVKVLGQLPDMKESAGLTIRISNAAAAEMGQTSDRFTVQVSY
ncbi:LysM peptidoglycan-binding domain-containing protein [Puia sp.]|jgi:LysM repeat protein|uniref:LysM peptidoglycan-binding domain-containing protein n=1 Tax=Puia sp. TaxID=2045100 RepID=UPI002F421AC7